MEKEALIQGLKERLGNNASELSDRSYDEIAEAALPAFADDSTVSEETWTLPVRMLSSLVGQYHHDVATGIASGKVQWEADKQKAIEAAVKAAKKEWEAEKAPAVQPSEGTKVATDDIDSKIDAKMDALFAKLTGDDGAIGKLSKSVNSLMATYDQQRREATVKAARKQVADYLTEMGATSKPAANLAVKQLEIGDVPDIDALKLDAKKSYEAIYNEFYSDGGKPYGGGDTGGEGGSDEQLKSYLKQKQQQIEKEAQEAETLRKKFK